ncbi:GNAT family N-acetyltransferase [Streptomyces sp. H27-D2]|uniref:GNAT family N-acetyltransferase n=1 Tax=Streptomyces sp. H27-D2 TaxID=3046304 RepID=UPI002DBF8DB9|nr:GNAT family N-acetyltransferase [Streptomyces sp. H27-D2]MEC4019626.1 GNAT family N-acetyltransferase [Streptomyces sp. H27-D2]
MEPITLTTERLVLRPLGPPDADAVLAACQNAEIQRWTTIPSPYGREHAEDFVGRISPDGWREDTLYNFGVFTKEGRAEEGSTEEGSTTESGVLVGSMGLLELAGLRGPQRQAEIGFWTAAEQRGRGYTAEAARALARWAFVSLGVERLEWFAEAGNHGSRAVALSVGFRMEGTQRARIVHRGVRRDAWAAALLPSDWQLPSKTPYVLAP